jgi:hypothetical protein
MDDGRTAEQLQAAIEASEQEYEVQRIRELRADEETVAAEERQRLRRRLEDSEAATEQKRQDAISTEMFNQTIDEDEDGSYLQLQDSRFLQGRKKAQQQDKVPIKSGSVSKHDAYVVKKEYEWKITGMSWLETSLKQSGETCATSHAFGASPERDDNVGFLQEEPKFALMYNPGGAKLKLPSSVGGCSVWEGAPFYRWAINSIAYPCTNSSSTAVASSTWKRPRRGARSLWLGRTAESHCGTLSS